MQTSTAQYKTAIAAPDREIRGYIKFNGTYTLSGEDGLISFKVSSTAMNAERFCVGAVTSAMCEASFYNYGMEGSGVSLANSYFDAYIGVVTDPDNNTVEYKCCGRFYMSELSRSADTTRIVGYDIAGRLAMNYVPTVTADPDDGYLAMDILNDIISQTGINGGELFTQYGDSTYVPQLFEGTCRDTWGWITTMIDEDVKSWSGNRDPYELGYVKGYSVGNGEATPYAIDETTTYMDGLSIGDAFTVTSYTTGTSETPIVVGNGTGVYGLNPYMTQAAAENVEDTVDGYTYYPTTIHWRGDPCLDLMDEIAITSGENTFLSVVMRIETTFNGGLEQTITCWGDSEDYYAMSTSPTQEKLNVVSDLVRDIQQAIETADGGVITKILDTDGTWKELVIANNQDLSQATSVWRFNINGLAHSNRYQGGTYTLAIDMQGRVVANVIQTGILQDAQGNNAWNLDTGAFTITNGSINITTASATSDQIVLKYGDYQSAFRPTGFETKYNNLVTTSMNSYGSINSYFREIPGVVDSSSTQFGCWGGTKYKSRSWLRFDGVGVEGGPNGATSFDRYGGRGYFGIDVATGTTATPTYDTFVHLEKWGNGTKTKGAYLDVNGLQFYDSNGNTTAMYSATGDTIAAYGTSGVWTYRRWSSKVFECWTVIAPTEKTFSAWGTGYYSTEMGGLGYPVTFKSAPTEIPSVVAGHAWYSLMSSDTANTTTTSGKYRAYRPVSGNAYVGLALYVKGELP